MKQAIEWLLIGIVLLGTIAFFTACPPRDIYTVAYGAKVQRFDLYRETCIDDQRLAELTNKTLKKVVSAARETGLLTKEPTWGPRICFVRGEHKCNGQFSRLVRGCAGSNAVIIGVDGWSTKGLLTHELLKWLIVSRHTSIGWDTPDKEMSTDPLFLKTEKVANE